MSSKNPNTVYFESGFGKYVKTFRTRPEWVGDFLLKQKNVGLALEARKKGDVDAQKRIARRVTAVNTKIAKNGAYAEYVCEGRLKV